METNELIKIYEKTVVNKEKDEIPLQFLCDFFDIDFEHQRKSINDHPYLKTQSGNKIFPDFFESKQKRSYLTKKGFLFWVLQLNYNIIKKETQGTFIDYQSNLREYLWEAAEVRDHELNQKALARKKRKQFEFNLKDNADFIGWQHAVAEEMRSGKNIGIIDKKEIDKREKTLFDTDEFIVKK